MIRIAGISLPDAKRAEVALTALYGIGPATARNILHQANIGPEVRVKNLTPSEAERIRTIVNKIKIEGELRMQVTQNIKRLKEIHAYRGLRHIRGLPVRGQRTSTNARTKRGKRVTVGSGRKKESEKT